MSIRSISTIPITLRQTTRSARRPSPSFARRCACATWSALRRVVLYGRERMIMLEPRDKGILATSLRYDYEVRDDKAYFDDIPEVEIGKEMLDLALAHHRRQDGQIRSRDVQGRLSGGGRRS